MSNWRSLIWVVVLVAAAVWYQQYRALGRRAERLNKRIEEDVVRPAGRFDSPEELSRRILELARGEGIVLDAEQVTVRFVGPDAAAAEAEQTPPSELAGLEALLVVELRYDLQGMGPFRRHFDRRLEKPIAASDRPFIPSAPPAIGRAVDPGVPAKKDVNAYRRDVRRAMGR